MIVITKDKTLDNYFIDENGVITDENGTVQKLTLHRGRLNFKGVGVHKIQMWTKYGYRDTKIWAIHHIDENPLNNSISNLVYMTRSEHTKLHWKGKKFSEKHIKNLSKAHIGFKPSKETLAKLHIAHLGNTNTKGRIWVNNGIENKLVKKNDIPDGFIKGRIYIKK